MLFKSLLLLTCLVAFNYANSSTRYDRFTLKKVTSASLKKHTANNTLNACTIEVKKCNAKERRRIDGSCNNLKHPAAGTFTVPHARVLPAAYVKGRYERKAVSGKALRLPREIRTRLLCEGESINTELTQVVPGFGIFNFADVGTIHDIKFFILNKTDCCGAGKNDYMCTPNIIPEDDPVHRFSGINCMNLTRPTDFQFYGCTNDPVPSMVEEATSVYDLSLIYNAKNDDGVSNRLFKGGLFITEEEKGIIWPPNGENFCAANSPGQKCFKNYSNSLLPVQLLSIWFMRQHNYFAKALSKLNPCWDDEHIYQVARDLNIAFAQQVHIYEWMATIIGKQNIIDSGVAGSGAGFRDIYNERMLPETTLEYILAMRWFHLIQNGPAKMYDVNGNYLKDHPVVNSTFRSGFLAEDNNLLHITQGFFRTEANKANHGVHPDIAERGLPNIQLATDIVTSDLHKNRLFGLRPYIDYLKHYFGVRITCFEDLSHFINKDKIFLLKRVYDDVRDIDLMAGLWSERLIEGGHIPITLAAIIKENVFNNIKGDRHWYERKSRPHAFTKEQLLEVRKASIALLMCSVADGMSVVQKNVFMNIGPKNPLVSCNDIPKIDFSKWVDHSCSNDCPV